MELGLKNKVAVITGGTTGIGKAAALSLAQEGCKIAVCTNDKITLASMSEEFQQKGYTFFGDIADVSDYNQLMDFAEKAIKNFGQIDIWINNAAVYEHKSIIDMDVCDWDKTINVNLKAVYMGCKIAATQMKERNGGVIINASSFAALIPNAADSAYGASKAAVLNLTKTAAAEFAPFNIRVNAYIPGVIETEMTKGNIAERKKELVRNIALNKIGAPNDVANVIVFLASDAAQYVTGTSIEISGGKLCVQNPYWGW